MVINICCYPVSIDYIALKESFEKVRSWYQRAKQLGGEDIEPILIGNKTDLGSASREVSTSEGQALAKELGALC